MAKVIWILCLAVGLQGSGVAAATEKNAAEANSTISHEARKEAGLQRSLKLAKSEKEKKVIKKLWSLITQYDYGRKGSDLQFLIKLRPLVREWSESVGNDPVAQSAVIKSAETMAKWAISQSASAEVKAFQAELLETARELTRKYPANPAVLLAYAYALSVTDVDDLEKIRAYRDCAYVPHADPYCRIAYDAFVQRYERPRCPSGRVSPVLQLFLATEAKGDDYEEAVLVEDKTLYRKKKPSLVSEDFQSLDYSFNPKGEAVVNLTFTKDGSEKFAKITGENIGKFLITYVDKEPVIAPKIMEKIEGDKVTMTLGHRDDPAKTLQEAYRMIRTLCADPEYRMIPPELVM